MPAKCSHKDVSVVMRQIGHCKERYPQIQFHVSSNADEISVVCAGVRLFEVEWAAGRGIAYVTDCISRITTDVTSDAQLMSATARFFDQAVRRHLKSDMDWVKPND